MAYGIMDNENDASCQWFFKQLLVVVGGCKYLYFVSYRHASIRRGIQKVFPKAGHGYCHVHLECNVSAKFKYKGLSNLVGRAAKTFRIGEFTELFNEIERRNEKCAAYLRKIGFQHWSRANCTGDRYNLMSSNKAESFNAVVERAKGFPIISMLEYVRTVMMRWYAMRRAIAKKHNSQVTPNVDKHLVSMLK